MAELCQAFCKESMIMAQIPIASDVAELIGAAAEKVENRSLLLDKFVFHKRWPEAVDSRGEDVKWDEASRWSFMRIADGAAKLLNKDALEKRRLANGNNVGSDKQERLLAEAIIAEALAKVAWDSKELAALRARHTRRFLYIFRRAFAQKASVLIGRLEGRLAINLSDSLIQNAGICLDRLFGLPYIPGSAIKGVCRHAALQELKNTDSGDKSRLFATFRSVFGTVDNDYKNGELESFRPLLNGCEENQKGAIAFLPSYPVNEASIVVDLTNVHYPEYYRSGRVEDLANERPRPNPFPAVESGAQFAFCLVLNGINNDPELLRAAKRWLECALTISGLGAKTASGYGWFSLCPEVLEQILDEERRKEEAAAAKAKADVDAKAAADIVAKEEAERMGKLSPEEQAAERFAAMNAEDFAKAASGIASLSPLEQNGLLLALCKPSRRDSWKNWKKSEKASNKARVEALIIAAKNLGVSLP